MAYFPNGSAGEVLDFQCAECLPYDACPIAWVQLEYNYTQCDAGQEKLRAAMNCLINDKGICQMKQFVHPRLTQGFEEKKKALERPLVFGDSEQIEALNDNNFKP